MSNIDRIVVLDRVTLVAPLGVLFWDVVTGLPVTDALQVTAYPKDAPALRTTGVANASGIVVFHHLPGLAAVETGSGQPDFWKKLPIKPRPFVLEVTDLNRRYQPFTLAVDLPVKGLLKPACVPDLKESIVPMYSTADRVPPEGKAIVRAQLFDPLNKVPCAWAVLQVMQGANMLGQGIADKTGAVVAFFNHPALSKFSSDTKPDPAKNVALNNQVWSVDLKVLYDPKLYAKKKPIPSIPNLCSVLAQPAANVWSDWTLALPRQTLQFGRELVARSRDPKPHVDDPAKHDPLSVLHVTKAGATLRPF